MPEGDRIIRPDPDPTTATKEYVENAVKAAIGPLIAQFNASQKAIDVLAIAQVKEPQASQVSSDVAHLKELTRTQIDDLRILVTQTFDAFKTLVEETNKLNDKALKAAFDASSQVVVTQQQFNDKATTKAEASFTTQIGEVTKRLELNVTGLTDKIDEDRKSIEVIGTRLTTVEGRRTGETEHKVDARANISSITGWIFGSIMAIGIILTLVLRH